MFSSSGIFCLPVYEDKTYQDLAQGVCVRVGSLATRTRRDEALLALRLALHLSVLARPKRQRFQQRPWRISTTKRDQVHEAIL